MTRTGIEQGGGAQHRSQSPSGALVSPRVPTVRNVYRGCCTRKGVFNLTRTGIEQGGGAKHRNHSPTGALASPRVPTSRNVYRGCCWKTPSVFALQIHLPQRWRLLGREAKLCHLNNTAPAEPCASVHGSAGAVCHLIGCFPECKPRCPPARRPGRRLRQQSALRGRGSPTGPPWRADGRCGR